MTTGKLRIRNWRKYQHYSDRNPPWLKLHRELLDSEDWLLWDDASRVLAVVCLCAATRDKTLEGIIPASPAYYERYGHLNGKANLKPLIDSGFIIPHDGDASTMLAQCYQDASPETETEAETEAENIYPAPRKKFIKPTIEEVRQHISENGYTHVDAESFWYFYESKGWMVGKNKMKEWHKALAGWDAREKKKDLTPQERRLAELKRERGI